uniref:Uncharacterized protein n=1 Tax=Meloidogyne enterolobii TaxID=390850 RepID=A0A6V7XJU8_MELEN|nr:unnamed protein product [Meloidogyne enterolobii]
MKRQGQSLPASAERSKTKYRRGRINAIFSASLFLAFKTKTHKHINLRGKKFLPLRRKPGMSSGTTAAASLRSPRAKRARPQRSTAIV